MKHTVELLDRYKKAAGLKSDNAAAITLGVTRSTVSAWRHGKNRPDPETVEAMARAAGLNAAKWVPLVESERAKTQEARATWLRIAGAACMFMALLTQSRGTASAQDCYATITQQAIHMRKYRRVHRSFRRHGFADGSKPAASIRWRMPR